MHAGTWIWLFAFGFGIGGGVLYLFRADTGTIAELVGMVLFYGGAVVFVIMSIGVGVTALETRECETKAEALGRDSRYSWNAGCFVESDDGSFVPIDNLRVTKAESD